MLRAFQTRALSDKVSRLFDLLAEKAMPNVEPILASAHRPSNADLYLENSALSARRRRRYRRSRLSTVTGSIRTSWF